MLRRLGACAVSGWLIPVWLIAVAIAWNAGASANPRKGWSLARIWVGLTGPSPSGDRAYLYHHFRYTLHRQEDGTVWVATDRRAGGGYALVEPLIRRSRYGLFVPCFERTDLRVLDYTQQNKDWRTGSASPDWGLVLEALRERPQVMPGAREQRLTDAIEQELAGGFPVSRALFPAIALDLMSVLSHVFLLISVTNLARRWSADQRRSARRRDGRGVECGYERAGLGSCPEFGEPEP